MRHIKPDRLESFLIDLGCSDRIPACQTDLFPVNERHTLIKSTHIFINKLSEAVLMTMFVCFGMIIFFIISFIIRASIEIYDGFTRPIRSNGQEPLISRINDLMSFCAQFNEYPVEEDYL